MVKQHPSVPMPGPRILSLAAAALVLFLSWPVDVAAEQRLAMMMGGNISMCGPINVDGNTEDGGHCLPIAVAQPQLEGFEMASELGSAVSNLRPDRYKSLVGKAGIPGKSVCGRIKDGRYTGRCTPAPGKPKEKCDTFKRDCNH